MKFSTRSAARELNDRIRYSRKAGRWSVEADIPWHFPITLSGRKAEAAWNLTSSSSFNEETGLLAATKLLMLFDDMPARLCLATQVTDEAKHLEVFARYAALLGGDVRPPQDSSYGLLQGIEQIQDPLGLFVVHTLLEGMALDEFTILEDCFRGDPLGTIYSYVRRDEARHVAMGLSFIQFALQENVSDEVCRIILWCKANTFAIAQIQPSWLQGMANLSGKSFTEIERHIVGRYQKRVSRLLSTLPKGVTHEEANRGIPDQHLHGVHNAAD